MNKESEHFIACTTCGQEFDMRDLSQVAEHFHESEVSRSPEQAKKVAAKKVGDSTEWRDGKPTHLN